MQVFRNGMATGVLLGVGLVLLAPALLPVMVRGARPVLKAILRTGVGVYERGRETLAEVSEEIEDMVAEVRSEIFEERAAAMATGPMGPGSSDDGTGDIGRAAPSPPGPDPTMAGSSGEQAVDGTDGPR